MTIDTVPVDNMKRCLKKDIPYNRPNCQAADEKTTLTRQASADLLEKVALKPSRRLPMEILA